MTKNVEEELVPEIGVYDRNGAISGLNDFYREAREKGIDLCHADNLEYLKGCKQVIVNPPGIIFEDSWKRIGKYINENPTQEIFLFAPDNTSEEIEKFFGKPENVKNIAQKINRDINVNWKMLYDLIGGRGVK